MNSSLPTPDVQISPITESTLLRSDSRCRVQWGETCPLAHADLAPADLPELSRTVCDGHNPSVESGLTPAPEISSLLQSEEGYFVLHDRYQIVQQIGRGGFGVIFLARDLAAPQPSWCVIKQLCPISTAPYLVKLAGELFRQEAKTLERLGDHPQIPQLLDYFETQQGCFLVQNYIHGLTLKQEVKLRGPFSEAEVKQVLRDMLQVLRYVHSQQVIHRDIKPSNVIRRHPNQQLVLIDFGVVHAGMNAQAGTAAVSEYERPSECAVGTVGFAAPEQMNMQPVFASDLYALGVTCIYLLTGRSPKSIGYHPVTGELLWRQHVHVNDAFAWILQKLLAVAVDRRYQSADQVLRALDRTTARQQRSGSRMISLPQKNAVPFSYQNTLAICQFMTGFPAADQLCFQCG